MFRSVVVCLALLSFASAACAEPVPAARILVLARHGHYEADPAADPKLGPGLSALGIAQAQLLGARLAGLPDRFDAILASPLTRAQETARVIADDLPGVPMSTIADLAECTPPTRRPQAVAGVPAEALKACADQLDRLFTEHFKPATGAPRRELLVCHGNVIRYLTTKAIGVDSGAWLDLSVGHTSLTTIRIEADGSMRLVGSGDIGHIPANLQTGALGDPERKLAVPAR